MKNLLGRGDRKKLKKWFTWKVSWLANFLFQNEIFHHENLLLLVFPFCRYSSSILSTFSSNPHFCVRVFDISANVASSLKLSLMQTLSYKSTLISLFSFSRAPPLMNLIWLLSVWKYEIRGRKPKQTETCK